MRKLSITQQKIAAWAGIIGPALFVAVFIIEGLLRPDYNAFSTYVSALSLGPRGWIQIVKFHGVRPALIWFRPGGGQ